MINGVVDKDLGYQLLSEIRENIKNAYQQRIELFRMMNINPKTLLEKQKITLNDFDTLVNGFLSKEVGPKL
jgi:ATP-dependent Zn protease